jgi:hypothetical protein
MTKEIARMAIADSRTLYWPREIHPQRGGLSSNENRGNPMDRGPYFGGAGVPFSENSSI